MKPPASQLPGWLSVGLETLLDGICSPKLPSDLQLFFASPTSALFTAECG